MGRNLAQTMSIDTEAVRQINVTPALTPVSIPISSCGWLEGSAGEYLLCLSCARSTIQRQIGNRLAKPSRTAAPHIGDIPGYYCIGKPQGGIFRLLPHIRKELRCLQGSLHRPDGAARFRLVQRTLGSETGMLDISSMRSILKRTKGAENLPAPYS